jgi:hypothetical protein
MKTAIRCLALLVIAAVFIGADDASKKERRVTLEMRKDSGPYKKSAYSFRKATGDDAVHRNYVDLLLNRCGSVHVNMVSGQKNRVCDLGESKLKDAPSSAPTDAKWLDERFKPEAGHAYLQEIKHNDQTMTVKFVVEKVTDEKVELTWVTIKPLEGPEDARRGAAGTKGQCGGPHKD